MLGILDENGFPKQQMGVLAEPAASGEPRVMAGAKCPECGNQTLIRKDGCDYCTSCAFIGVCG